MKSKIILIALAAAAMAVPASLASASTPRVHAHAIQRPHKERHPELRRALMALQRAAGFLNRANRDFEGHRAKAAEHIQQAIAEVQAAIRSDQH